MPCHLGVFNTKKILSDDGTFDGISRGQTNTIPSSQPVALTRDADVCFLVFCTTKQRSLQGSHHTSNQIQTLAQKVVAYP